MNHKHTPVDISRALTIPGWMGEEELTWLAERAKESREVVEVGCWMGRTTMALSQHCSGRVWAVDHWEGSEEHKEFIERSKETWLFDQFNANMRDQLVGGGGNVVVVHMASIQAADFMRRTVGARFDLVFLDATHDYDAVKADILVWRPLLSPSGLLCGHDFRPSWPGVIKAVKELVPNFQLVQPTERCAIWWWKNEL